MWLPETAADTETLEVLAEEGIAFTILSPYQAKRFRPEAGGEWSSVEGGQIDPTRPYWVLLPGGKRIAVFFYDGPIAKALAFEGGLASPDGLVDRLHQGFDPNRGHEELLNVAVDGETFGHHKKGGDEVLAQAIRLAPAMGLRLTNYGEFLARRPPTHVVELIEPSSWSCAHGVERWRADCGCTTAGLPGWHQGWRAPLREALEGLRNSIDAFFEQEGGKLFRDPWEARDAYVELVLDKRPEAIREWMARHEGVEGALLDPARKVQALRLLEAQRNSMMMFTSCGWFFAEISSLEASQVLRYAARALQLTEEAGGPRLEESFIEELALAPSNLPGVRDGWGVWERNIRPSIASLPGIRAHHAIVSMSDPGLQEKKGRLFCYGFERLAERTETAGPATLSLSRTLLTSENTLATLDAVVAVLHFGGNDFRCSVQPYVDAETYKTLEADLFRPLSRFNLSEVIRAMDHHFIGPDFGLRNLFLDERRALAKSLLRETRAKWERDYRRIYEENLGLMTFLLETNIPIPQELLSAATLSLSRDVAELVDGLVAGEASPGDTMQGIQETVREASRLGLELPMKHAKRAVERRIRQEMRALLAHPTNARAEELIELVDLGASLGTGLDLWAAQNLFWELIADPPQRLGSPVILRLGERLWIDRETLSRKLEQEAWQSAHSSLS
jgi:hypothetical protein